MREPLDKCLAVRGPSLALNVHQRFKFLSFPPSHLRLNLHSPLVFHWRQRDFSDKINT